MQKITRKDRNMEKANIIKNIAIGAIGIVGSAIANALGGFDMALQILIGFMIADYITGLIVAGVFNKSGKSENGALESRAGWKGLCRKGMTLVIVIVATQLDRLTGNTFIRDAVIIGYAVNETLSIIENAGLMGLWVPEKLINAVDILKEKSEEE